MQLLVQKALESSYSALTAGEPIITYKKVVKNLNFHIHYLGDALRRVLAALSTGLLLPGGNGIRDPCEREETDASATLTNQQREDITFTSQAYLRLISFMVS